MRALRLVLATAVAAAGLVVLPVQVASAESCVLADQELHFGEDGISWRCKAGARSVGDFTDPNLYAQAPGQEAWRGQDFCGFWEQCSRQVQPNSGSCWFCQSSGGVEQIQRQANHEVATRKYQRQQASSSDSTHGGRTMPGVPCMICGGS